MHVLVLNCGSSTVKFKLFSLENDTLTPVDSGLKEVDRGYGDAIRTLVEELPATPDLVAHRVVHGGELYSKPVKIDAEVIRNLERLSTLAPLHNPPALEGIAAASDLNAPQYAAFDTSFHQGMPPEAFTYALPQDLARLHGLRRYGFHGHSHQYVSERYAELSGNAEALVITLHLGSGASAAAICAGRCIDTSMGTTPLEGLVMATRGGDIDPAVIFHLLRNGTSLDDCERLFWRESGLKGLGGTADMRELLARDDEASKLAIELFCYRIRKYIGAYMAVLGGLDALVFTGGIGENSPEIREKILAPLQGMGFAFDPARNLAGDKILSAENSAIDIRVIPTDEEFLIARLVWRQNHLENPDFA